MIAGPYNALTYLWAKFLKKARFAAIRNSVIHRSSKVEPGTSFVSSTMDRHSFCGYDCDISFAQIGSFVSIANGVVIGGGRHPMEWIAMSPVFYEGRDSVKAKYSTHSRIPNKPVEIGHDVWVGRNAIILPGVRIGHGAVVGAGSVVTKDVAPYAIVAGNPARLVRFRFSETEIAALLDFAWWSLADPQLRAKAQLFNNAQLIFQKIMKKNDNE